MQDADFIQFRTLTKEFQAPDGSAIRVVDPIGLTIREGEFVVFVGPSGCGKTTVMRMVGGLEAPTSGEIYLAGKLVTGPSRDKGMVFKY
jgi:NitT/TauT family transport system ATP-binding protein